MERACGHYLTGPGKGCSAIYFGIFLTITEVAPYHQAHFALDVGNIFIFTDKVKNSMIWKLTLKSARI